MFLELEANTRTCTWAGRHGASINVWITLIIHHCKEYSTVTQMVIPCCFVIYLVTEWLLYSYRIWNSAFVCIDIFWHILVVISTDNWSELMSFIFLRLSILADLLKRFQCQTASYGGTFKIWAICVQKCFSLPLYEDISVSVMRQVSFDLVIFNAIFRWCT